VAVFIGFIGNEADIQLRIRVGKESSLSVEKRHKIAKKFQHELLLHLKYLSDATIHADPEIASGSDHHHITEHNHDRPPVHSH
jgi:divalent metal cation (Fe/Co/Zn/Cd) transporter